jgi:hypothetical protein
MAGPPASAAPVPAGAPAWPGGAIRSGSCSAGSLRRGSALMTYTYAGDLVPGMGGIDLAEAGYDMADRYARDSARIGPVHGNDGHAVPSRTHSGVTSVFPAWPSAP